MQPFFRRFSFLAISTSLVACGGSPTFPDEPVPDVGTDTVAVDASLDAADLGTSSDGGDDASDASPKDVGPSDVPFDDVLPEPCTATGTECGPSRYCDAPTCDKGTCKPRPASIGAFNPACGCDGVSYFSAEYAASLGRSSIPGGACAGTARATCSTVKPCPHAGDICTNELASCSLPIPDGSCWSMPKSPTCPTTKGTYSICGAGGATGTCITLCDAVLSTKTYALGCK